MLAVLAIKKTEKLLYSDGIAVAALLTAQQDEHSLIPGSQLAG